MRVLPHFGAASPSGGGGRGRPRAARSHLEQQGVSVRSGARSSARRGQGEAVPCLAVRRTKLESDDKRKITINTMLFYIYRIYA